MGTFVDGGDLEEVGLDVRDQRRRAERAGQHKIAALLQEAEGLIVEAMDLADDDPDTMDGARASGEGGK